MESVAYLLYFNKRGGSASHKERDERKMKKTAGKLPGKCHPIY